MDASELERFEELYERFEAGDRENALAALQEFARGITDAWEKAELCYHETLWLLELARLAQSRASLARLKESVAALTCDPPDDEGISLPVRLAIEAQFAEMRVLFSEEENERALEVLEDLLRRYPRRLSTPDFSSLRDQLPTFRGLLLGNLDRWAEAKEPLEHASSPKSWMNIVTYNLGQCYYTLGDYTGAKARVLEALEMKLPSPWEAGAHYLLGIIFHKLGQERSALDHFQFCAKLGPPNYLATTKIWEWLEATSSRLGLIDQAEAYRRTRTGAPGPLVQ